MCLCLNKITKIINIYILNIFLIFIYIKNNNIINFVDFVIKLVLFFVGFCCVVY